MLVGSHRPHWWDRIREKTEIFEEQQNWETACGHLQHHANILHNITGSQRSKVHYRQAQINGNHCTCRISFGGDDKWRNSGCPREASRFHWGRLYETALIEETLKAHHHEVFGEDKPFPFWIQKGTFHTLFNKYLLHENQSWYCFIEPTPMKSGGISWTTRIPPLVVASKANPLDPICCSLLEVQEFWSFGGEKGLRRRFVGMKPIWFSECLWLHRHVGWLSNPIWTCCYANE